MPEFEANMLFEMVYWLNEDAWCWAFATKYKPISFKLTTNNKFGQCSKVLIKCLDDINIWTSDDQKWLE